jgi:hypothetical protein
MKYNDSIKWHPAFFQAIQLELADYADSLDFSYEFQLTSDPLRIDVLILKKSPSLIIPKNIARIFKSANLIEYKSPGDYFSVKDFLKMYAYACLYAIIRAGVKFSDITLTFIGNRYSRELIRYLREERGYVVEERDAGIYEVRGDYLSIQIIESKKLRGEENIWLKGLTNDLEEGLERAIVEEGIKQGEGVGTYLEAVIRANAKRMLEGGMGKRRESFEEVFTKAGIIPEWIEKGREERGIQIAKNALAEGLAVEIIQKITGLDPETIKDFAAQQETANPS